LHYDLTSSIEIREASEGCQRHHRNQTSQNTVDLEAWQYFRKLLEYLSIDGMSSEEAAVRDIGGQKVTVFLIKLCVWRTEEITEYLKFIDIEANNPIFQDRRGVKACARIPVDTPSS
jgi:hypothetical protein